MDGVETPVGPVVQFPDPGLVAQLARFEAKQERPPVVYAWAKGISSALALALVGGVIFAAVSEATGAQFGLVSIVIGIAAGIGAAKGGRSRHAQIVGAVAAAVGYFAGQVMAVAAFVGSHKFFSLSLDQVGMLARIIVKETFSGMGVLFLGIAVYEGWKIPEAAVTADVIFRPRIAAYVMGAAMMTMVVYVVFLIVDKSSRPDYPFGLAALVGGVNLVWNLLAKARKHGVRADIDGVTDLHTHLALRWDEIDAIRLDIEQVQLAKGMIVARVATLAAGDRKLRFADLGPGRPPRVGDTVNLESAGLLLALAAARTRATALYPPSWSEPAALPEPEPAPSARRFDVRRAGGLGAMTFKVGPKIVSIAFKLLKSIKLGSVAVAIGVYTLIWSWQFACSLVGMILVHECGHAFAMWRSGVPVKGIYFIPFFGGAAVSKGVAKTRARSAFIAINGPIWGTVLALGCFGAFALGGGEQRFLGTLAAWGALLNLFNLLPIFPLDGGRIVASLAHASRRGVPIVAASLVLGGTIAYLAKLELLMLVGFLGLLEFGTRLAAATYGPALALVARPVSPADHEHFAHHVAYAEVERDAPDKRELREQLFVQRKAEAEQTPMTFAQATVVLGGYLLVVGVLVAILFLTANIAGSGSPLDLLH